MITQTLGKSSERNQSIREKVADAKVSPLQWRNGSINKPDRKRFSLQQTYDWHETSTIITALKQIESWIFNRIVESVWWQALTPYMQSAMEKTFSPISLRPYSGERNQGNFSVSLWTMAFHDAFTRLCPLRSGGNKCGCLPELANLVMKHCIARLDVAMVNAILSESTIQVPTDPIADPIADPNVLPIPPRDLSFGTGAQLRNAIGNWSISLTEKFGMDVPESRSSHDGLDDDDDRKGTNKIMWFRLLHELSELLMLPKDMLLEAPIRQEVCPSFGLPLIIRILSIFTPDEFCPDHVPSFVLDELNSESVLEATSDIEKVTGIPCAASTIVYHPSTLGNSAAVELAIAEEATSKLDNKDLSVETRGYPSEDDLRELDLPLSFSDDKGVTEMSQKNERYKLLQEIWSE